MEIGLLDRAATVQVVARDEGDLRRARRQVGRAAQAPAHERQRAPQRRADGIAFEPFPLLLERRVDLSGDRAGDLDRKVPARLVEPCPVVLEIVDDIDPADEGDLAVDRGNLAVRAGEAEAAEQTRIEDAELHAVRTPIVVVAQGLRRADAVSDHAHRQAAPRGFDEGGADLGTGFVIAENVDLEHDAGARPPNPLGQCGEVGGAGLEQP